jgi:hypothetical protein
MEMSFERTLVAPEEISGFVKQSGVPNTSQVTPYFAAFETALKRCEKDPNCKGLSAFRMFYGTVKKGSGISLQGEDWSFVKKG